MATLRLETEVLKPRDPSIANENDWPEFQLHNAEVRNAARRLSNLLHAGDDTPVTITGDLVALDTIQPYRASCMVVMLSCR